MSKLFFIEGDHQEENGTWHQPRPEFTGQIVIKDNGEVYGSVAYRHKMSRHVYGVALPQENGNYAIAFALMSGLLADPEPVTFLCSNVVTAYGNNLTTAEEKNTPNGTWGTFFGHEPMPCKGNSRVKLTEASYDEKTAMDLCCFTRQTNLKIDINAYILGNYEMFKELVLQMPGVLPADQLDDELSA